MVGFRDGLRARSFAKPFQWWHLSGPQWLVFAQAVWHLRCRRSTVAEGLYLLGSEDDRSEARCD